MLFLSIMVPVTGLGIWWNREKKKREKVETYTYVPCVTLRLIDD